MGEGFFFWFGPARHLVAFGVPKAVVHCLKWSDENSARGHVAIRAALLGAGPRSAFEWDARQLGRSAISQVAPDIGVDLGRTSSRQINQYRSFTPLGNGRARRTAQQRRIGRTEQESSSPRSRDGEFGPTFFQQRRGRRQLTNVVRPEKSALAGELRSGSASSLRRRHWTSRELCTPQFK